MTEDEAKRQISLQDYESESAEAQARIQYQVDYSKTLLGGLMVANGGSIIALLTFIGNSGDKIEPARMSWAFAFFAAGLVCVFLAYIGAFLCQFFYYNGAQFAAWNAQRAALGGEEVYDVARQMKIGAIAIFAAMAFAVLGLAAFICGSVAALDALT